MPRLEVELAYTVNLHKRVVKLGRKKGMKQVKSRWVLKFSLAGWCGVDLAFFCSLQIAVIEEQCCICSLLNHVGFPPSETAI